MSTRPEPRRATLRRDCRAEPSVAELLDDPVLQILMARDHVDRGDLEDLIERTRRHLNGDEPRHRPPARDILLADCWA
ncbi:MAG TPA: hypothetical protein VGB82_25225 [Alphaproteobacteria bacterium]